MSKPLNVGHLRRLIADLPDDAPVLVPAPDHSYRQPFAEVGPARLGNDGWSEDDGDTEPNNDLGKRYEVLIIQ